MAKRRSSLSEAPLFAWGDALRRAQMIRRRRRWRMTIGGAAIILLGGTTAFPPAPRLVWNASASAPVGLYAVSPGAPIAPGDMVVARLPDRWRLLAARRRYIPANVPLVKRVVAAAGDEVCALGSDIFVDGRWLATRRLADGNGRAMPWWTGCLRLRGRQLFLLMADNPASFDGRYFGVTEGNQVIGKARLLWAR